MNQHKKCTWRATQLRHQRRGMVAIDWVQKRIKDNEFDNEELFEVLDFDGENGPRQSRKNGSDNKLYERYMVILARSTLAGDLFWYGMTVLVNGMTVSAKLCISAKLHFFFGQRYIHFGQIDNHFGQNCNHFVQNKKNEKCGKILLLSIRVIKTYHLQPITTETDIILFTIRFVFNEGLILLIINVRHCNVIVVFDIQSKNLV